MNDLVRRDEVMKHITEEYNRRLPADGLKLAYIEKAVNEAPAAPLWNDAKKPPEDDRYILISYSNYSLPDIGQFRDGEYYPGDEDRSCENFGLHVNGWMELPKNNETK